MKTLVRIAFLCAGVLFALPAVATPVGTAFTYQGQLVKSGAPYAGAADFVFRLYDDPAAGSQVGGDVSLAGITVTAGLFTVDLDFGAVFDGTALWLEIQVQTPGDEFATTLAPRQALSATPYALHALSAPSTGGGETLWSSGAAGIHYLGKVGIATPANATTQLYVNTGTANVNPFVVWSNNPTWAAVSIRNEATNGIGLYDQWSDRHLLSGNIGIGTLTPGMPLDIVQPFNAGARITGNGNSLVPVPGEGVRAALFVHGHTGTGAGGASCGGIYSSSTNARAISGWSNTDWGVDGNNTQSGCYGALGTPNEAVLGVSPSTSKPAGKFIAPTNGIAIDALGLVKVKTLQILGGADLAEPFDVAAVQDATAEPGTVVVIDAASPGDMRVSDRAYDTRVAGVISGANDLSPGMVMKAEGAAHADGAHPVALSGRVWCKADASFGAIAPGDLLTTSPTAGHAMKAGDAERRPGAVIGKAMTSLEGGRGLVLVLVSLQ